MAGRIAYLGNITTQGLVLDLDAGIKGSYPGSGTTWTDISNNGNNGTLTNGPTFTGSDYGAIVFDGTNDFITGSVINTPNQLSVFCFKNPKPRVGSVYPTIISKWTNDAQGENRSWVVGSIPGGVDYLAISTNGTYTNSTVKRYEFSSSVSNNIWTQTGFTFNNGILTPYLNGAPVNYTAVLNPSITSIHTSNIPYTLGYSKDGAFDLYYSGSIGNAQIYNQSLNQFQVWQNFNSYKSRYGIPDIVTDGLVLNLDAGNPYSYLSGSSGTTWTDVSGKGNNGTLVNGPIYSNGAITFDGVDDYAVTTLNSTPTLNITTQITLESWIKSTALANVFHGDGVNSKGTSTDGNSGVYETLIISSGGINYPFFRMRIGSSTPTYSPTNIPLNLNQIYHFVSVYDGNTMRIFINGIESGVGLTQTGNIEANTQPLGIGCRYGKIGVSDVYFNGNIYSNKIYNRALSATEVQQNFNALRGRYGI
jgi:hypothetical protein